MWNTSSQNLEFTQQKSVLSWHNVELTHFRTHHKSFHLKGTGALARFQGVTMEKECVERSERCNICLTDSMTAVLQKALHMHINLLHSVVTERGPWLWQLWENLAVCIEAFNPATSESSDRTWDRKWHSSIVHGNRGSLWHNNDKRSRNSRTGLAQEIMYWTAAEQAYLKACQKYHNK